MAGNFDYYDIFLSFVWLFAGKKEYFAQLTFVWFYFLASTIKIHEGWIFGNYFSSLITGLPIFPNSIVPLASNIVIIMQMVGCWFLLSKNKTIREWMFYFFLFFHIYSGLIVAYRYITISMTVLTTLFFVNKNTFTIEKISKQTLVGYGLLLFLLIGQSTAILIPGDQKKTLEGNFYGLYMFEANHQCISKETITYNNKTPAKVVTRENHTANNRCDPYNYFYQIRTKCRTDSTIEKVSWEFLHSVNGNPYEILVHEDNACNLTYKTLSHNNWIRTSPEISPTPVYKNGYGASVRPDVTSLHIPTNPIKDDDLLALALKTYWIIWCATLATVVSMLIYATFRKK